MLALFLTSMLMPAASAAPVAAVRACTESPPPTDTIQWAIQRTVRVQVAGSGGTGVIVSPDGFALTAAHVVATPGDIEVIFADGESRSARVVRNSPESDLALLEIEGEELPCMAPIATQAGVGSDVYAIGSPVDNQLTHSVSKGIISGYREIAGRTMIQTDASINPGNSGGPLIDNSGKVLGIVSWKVVGDGLEGLGFAVAASNVPAELSIRWASISDDFQAEESTNFATWSATKVQVPDGVVIAPNQHYKLDYRPSAGPIKVGLLLTISAAVGAAWSADMARTEGISEVQYDGYRSVNTVSWSAIGVGALAAGLGFAIPTKRAPVRSHQVSQ